MIWVSNQVTGIVLVKQKVLSHAIWVVNLGFFPLHSRSELQWQSQIPYFISSSASRTCHPILVPFTTCPIPLCYFLIKHISIRNLLIAYSMTDVHCQRFKIFDIRMNGGRAGPTPWRMQRNRRPIFLEREASFGSTVTPIYCCAWSMRYVESAFATCHATSWECMPKVDCAVELMG